jgi:hypothetical protein
MTVMDTEMCMCDPVCFQKLYGLIPQAQTVSGGVYRGQEAHQ